MKKVVSCCDRCGKEYDYGTAIDIKILLYKYGIVNLGGSEVDLCPACLRSLKKWMKKENINENND